MSSLFSLIAETIAKLGLTVSVEGEAIILRRAAEKAAIPVWGGAMQEPSPEALFYQAITVLHVYDYCEDFLDWCDENGFNASDPKMLDRFKAIGEGRADLINLVGEDRYQELQGGLMISQAIENARPR